MRRHRADLGGDFLRTTLVSTPAVQTAIFKIPFICTRMGWIMVLLIRISRTKAMKAEVICPLAPEPGIK